MWNCTFGAKMVISHYYQKLQANLERLEWQRRYTKYTANQCCGDLALVSEDGYYAVPFCATYAPTGEYALVAGEYGTVLRVSRKDVKEIQFSGVSDAIFDMEWDPRSKDTLILASSDSNAYVWDLTQNACKLTVRSTDMLKRAKIYKEHLLITGGAAGKLDAWDVRGTCEKPNITIDAHSLNGKGSITSFAFGEDCIATIGTPDYRLKTWDLRMPKRPILQIESMCSQRERAYTGLDYCPLTRSWFASNTNNRLFRFNHLGVLCDTYEAPHISTNSFYTKLQVARDGRSVMCTSGNNQLHVWNVGSKDCVVMGDDCEVEVTAFAQCPTREELLIACEDGSVRLWSPDRESNEHAMLIPFQSPAQNDIKPAEYNESSSLSLFWPSGIEYQFEVKEKQSSGEQKLIMEYYSSEPNSKRPRLGKIN